MTAEILSVGTELLLGDILNTNARFLAAELSKLGINTYYQTVVGDNRARLAEAFRMAFSRADVVIATGGLGPTEDDLTKETAAEFFGLELVLHEESFERMKSYFVGQSREMPANNDKQAMLPRGCVVLPNDNGTAPGCVIEGGGKALVLLPGPPNEMEPMFIESVLPYLRPKTSGMLLSRVLKIIGAGESSVEVKLRDLMDGQTNPTLALYAKTGEVHLRVTARAKDADEANALIEPYAEKACRILGKNVYGFDNDTLASVVVDLLKTRKYTIACAESCTGGALTAALVDVAGVSEVLRAGLVTYANDAKTAFVGVRTETLERFGAVSEETAREMAIGVCRATGADVSVATTGIAGPGGGTAEKPVGLVYIACCVRGEVVVKECRFAGNRQKVRERSVSAALDMARRALIE